MEHADGGPSWLAPRVAARRELRRLSLAAVGTALPARRSLLHDCPPSASTRLTAPPNVSLRRRAYLVRIQASVALGIPFGEKPRMYHGQRSLTEKTGEAGGAPRVPSSRDSGLPVVSAFPAAPPDLAVRARPNRFRIDSCYLELPIPARVPLRDQFRTYGSERPRGRRGGMPAPRQRVVASASRDLLEHRVSLELASRRAYGRRGQVQQKGIAVLGRRPPVTLRSAGDCRRPSCTSDRRDDTACAHRRNASRRSARNTARRWVADREARAEALRDVASSPRCPRPAQPPPRRGAACKSHTRRRHWSRHDLKD